MATKKRETLLQGPDVVPLSREDRQRLALASMYPTMVTPETERDLLDLHQRATLEAEQQQAAARDQEARDNRRLRALYPSMVTPETQTTVDEADARTPAERRTGPGSLPPGGGFDRATLTAMEQASHGREDRAGVRKWATEAQALVRAEEELQEAARRAERVKNGDPSLSDLMFHTKYATSKGLETWPETVKRYFSDTKQWVKDNPLDAFALATTEVPLVGDVAGVAADIHFYYENPDEVTWQNLGLSAVGLVPWVPHGAVMIKSLKDVSKDLYHLARGGQVPVKVGELSKDQLREILKVVPEEAGKAFLLADRTLEATPKLVAHMRKDSRKYHDVERLIDRMPDYPSKGQVRANLRPNRAHRPMLLLWNKETKKYDILIIDAMEEPGKITPITMFEGGDKYGKKQIKRDEGEINDGFMRGLLNV